MLEPVTDFLVVTTYALSVVGCRWSCARPLLRQALLRPLLHQNFRDATSASTVYRSAKWNIRLLRTTTKTVLAVSPLAAAKFLHRRVDFPSRKGKNQFSTKSVYRYLKQTISYYYTTIRLTAVREFVNKLHEYSHQTVGRLYAPPNATRTRLILSREEANSLVAGGSFLTDVYAWPALVDAVAAVIKRLGGGAKFSEASPLPGRPPLVVCHLGHIAVVAMKVQEHLKRIAMIGEPNTGMNPGHRGPYVDMLAALHSKFLMSSLPQQGVRLVDGEDIYRAVVEEEGSDDDEHDKFSSDGSDDDDSEDGDSGNDGEGA